jgi:hypothetical protein
VQEAIAYAMPTKVSQLTNDSNYQTDAQVNSAIAAAIGRIETIEFEIVSQLPQTGRAQTIYLIANSGGSHDEYIYINGKWEKIGTTDIDLSGYMKYTDMKEITTAEIDAIVT